MYILQNIKSPLYSQIYSLGEEVLRRERDHDGQDYQYIYIYY